ncbi:3-deoxy-D-manno-octulosonate 8-phosphate phosphatase, YrbI family [Campylobacter blaseri]|uniref:3-deoxy-D-manno-octulosonate 8-phosphate phosphatase KdsC n=1 Tax=Campylobacter blaseri TaxID=2042961 RepID=A0A2P8R018_9BACT|nr:HAD-IIIA family hydrolase [Campylobacter blaseri]PSM51828.1 3-deoxy-D-manno-octulosonate 8-phosphate phosphatase [Campylobacter blaseri]PSM53619.1 3-deoxy-D-manno-octulosonate 8-phosphate phosphatase [Campylobacter blaseri]QKF86433.1 3-deoxy-D-manno-octulosonate 8-phosphate phosphatase, YrbI family [Campylobacter blaseri]
MIDIIFLDVDGCMSDGGIYYTNSKEEIKKFNTKDGFGIVNWIKLGKKVAIITGRKSNIVEYRAKELGIHYLIQNSKDKLSDAKEILKKEGLNFSSAAAIGDDLNDLKLLKAVKFSFKPKDAMNDIKTDITLSKKGGEGAIREMIEIIIEKDDLKELWLKKWL